MRLAVSFLQKLVDYTDIAVTLTSIPIIERLALTRHPPPN